MSTAVKKQDPIERYESQALALRDQCTSVSVIRDKEELQQSVERSQQCAKGRSIIESLLEPGIARAHQAHKDAIAEMKRYLAPLDEADAHEKQLRKDYYALTADAGEEKPKADGLTVRENWKHEVTDFEALVKAVAEGKENINCLLPNDKLFGAQVKVLKDQFVVTGVKAVRDFSDAVRK